VATDEYWAGWNGDGLGTTVETAEKINDPLVFCPLQSSKEFARNQTRASAARSRRLTVWTAIISVVIISQSVSETETECGNVGRAIEQAVSPWVPTEAARVRARVRSCGICGGQSGTGVGFHRELRFPFQIFIPPISPQSPSSIIWGWCHRQEVAAGPSGLSLTPLIIQFNSILYYLCAEPTAARPITGKAQCRHR
jgi:hypothetical protein